MVPTGSQYSVSTIIYLYLFFLNLLNCSITTILKSSSERSFFKIIVPIFIRYFWDLKRWSNVDSEENKCITYDPFFDILWDDRTMSKDQPGAMWDLVKHNKLYYFLLYISMYSSLSIFKKSSDCWLVWWRSTYVFFLWNLNRISLYPTGISTHRSCIFFVVMNMTLKAATISQSSTKVLLRLLSDIQTYFIVILSMIDNVY